MAATSPIVDPSRSSTGPAWHRRESGENRLACSERMQPQRDVDRDSRVVGRNDHLVSNALHQPRAGHERGAGRANEALDHAGSLSVAVRLGQRDVAGEVGEDERHGSLDGGHLPAVDSMAWACLMSTSPTAFMMSPRSRSIRLSVFGSAEAPIICMCMPPIIGPMPLIIPHVPPPIMPAPCIPPIMPLQCIPPIVPAVGGCPGAGAAGAGLEWLCCEPAGACCAEAVVDATSAMKAAIATRRVFMDLLQWLNVVAQRRSAWAAELALTCGAGATTWAPRSARVERARRRKRREDLDEDTPKPTMTGGLELRIAHHATQQLGTPGAASHRLHEHTFQPSGGPCAGHPRLSARPPRAWA